MGVRLITYLSNQNVTVCVLKRTQIVPRVISADKEGVWLCVCVCVKRALALVKTAAP